MSLLNYSTTWNDGQPGWGKESFNAAINAGYTGSEIAAFVNSGQARIGEKARDMAHGASSASRGNQAAIAAAEQAAKQAAKQQYNSQLQSYQTQLSDWSNKFNDVTNQYQTALTGKNEAEGRATEFEGKFQQATEDYESAKKLAETYKGEAVNRQLDSIRRGATYQGGQTNPYASIASGAVSNRQSQDKDMLVHVDKQVRAEDSVLASKGPVVQAIGSGNSIPRRQPDNNPLAGGGNQQANYYANRFG